MPKYKTLLDVDLIMAFQDGDVLMPLRNMYKEPAINLFKDMHLMHLININSKSSVIPYRMDFKEFLSEEVGISVRKLAYVIKKLVEIGYVTKEDGVYTLTDDFKKLFKRKKLKHPLEPFPDNQTN